MGLNGLHDMGKAINCTLNERNSYNITSLIDLVINITKILPNYYYSQELKERSKLTSA